MAATTGHQGLSCQSLPEFPGSGLNRRGSVYTRNSRKQLKKDGKQLNSSNQYFIIDPALFEDLDALWPLLTLLAINDSVWPLLALFCIFPAIIDLFRPDPRLCRPWQQRSINSRKQQETVNNRHAWKRKHGREQDQPGKCRNCQIGVSSLVY